LIVLDSSVLIDHLRGSEGARNALSRVDRAEFAASVLTRVEVFAGMYPRELWETRRLLDGLNWIEVDRALANEAADLALAYSRAYPGIDAADWVIAATALRLGADLWTQNVRHFPMFPGLRPPY
jgi:predicted nucleic acid-binding protein